MPDAPSAPDASSAPEPGFTGPSDELLHDLVRTAVDLLHPGIGVEASNRVFDHVPVAAEYLQAAVNDPVLSIRRPVLPGRRLLCRQRSLDVFAGEVVDEGADGQCLGGTFGEDEFRVLETEDGPAEGLRSFA